MSCFKLPAVKSPGIGLINTKGISSAGIDKPRPAGYNESTEKRADGQSALLLIARKREDDDHAARDHPHDAAVPEDQGGEQGRHPLLPPGRFL